jgi:hypothetical protein
MGEIRRKIDENATKGERLTVYCNNCKSVLNHVVLLSIDENGSEEYDEGFSIDWIDHYQIIQCQGCDIISFRHKGWFSEDQVYDSDGTSEYLYPLREQNLKRKMKFENVPNNLEELYNESVDSYNIGSLILCAGGLRSLVEGICIDQGINDKSNLNRKISGLHEKGILTESQTSILHELRFMGNNALHDLKKPTKKEFELAFDIIEHILKTIYDLPAKGNALKKKRENRTN